MSFVESDAIHGTKRKRSDLVRLFSSWKAGLAHYQFWWRFGLLDIRLRYRRTLLGPFWVTFSFAVSATAMTIVFSTLFKMTTEAYFAYLITGLAVWTFISSLVNDGCTAFINQAALIQQQSTPIFAYALRSVAVTFIIFLHNMIVVVIALLFFHGKIGWETLAVIPGLAIILGNGLWMAMLFGMLCARYRDLPQIIATLVGVTFFVTPVFWYKDMLSSRAYIADLNPLFSLLELVRAPLLGALPAMRNVWIALAMTAIGWLLAYSCARRIQARLGYWV